MGSGEPVSEAQLACILARARVDVAIRALQDALDRNEDAAVLERAERLLAELVAEIAQP